MKMRTKNIGAGNPGKACSTRDVAESRSSTSIKNENVLLLRAKVSVIRRKFVLLVKGRISMVPEKEKWIGRDVK